MATFFISDLHLQENHPDSYSLFTKFLNNLPDSTEAVYILGDFFEFWVDDKLNSNFIHNIKLLLQKYTSKFPIYLIKGNRDFLLGEHFATVTGCTLLPDITAINLYQHTILLLHGDQLCTDDYLYKYFSRMLRNPKVIQIFNSLPIWSKLIIAKIIRVVSKIKRILHNGLSKIKKKSNNLSDEIPVLMVERLLHQHHANVMIHGHTHKPNVYNLQLTTNSHATAATRVVLGDWNRSAIFLKFTQNGYELQQIAI